MIQDILRVGELESNCCILGDETAHQAAVVDPGGDAPAILAAIERRGLKVALIVITHAHIDHVGALREIKEATGAPVYLNEADLPVYEQMAMQAAWVGLRAPERVDIDRNAADGDQLCVGAVSMTVLHTPGHSPGGICLWVPGEKLVLSGDTLFRDGVGRTDLPGGDYRQLLRSIADKLLTLPDETTVIPGHGDRTTIGRERRFNPFLAGLR